MRALVQWVEYDTSGDRFWDKGKGKRPIRRLVQRVVAIRKVTRVAWKFGKTRKHSINVFDLDRAEWVQESYPEFISKAPRWIHDPLLRAAKAVSCGSEIEIIEPDLYVDTTSRD